MELHVATGYRHDDRNRLAGVNDWVPRPVPRFWLGRTIEGVARAQSVMSAGRVALYSTGWENAASQRLAARAGAGVFGEEYHIA